MTQIDEKNHAHHEHAGAALAARYLTLPRTSGDAAIVGVEGEQTAAVMLARADLTPARRTFWHAIAAVFANRPGATVPVPPTPKPDDAPPPAAPLSMNPNAPRPDSNIRGLLSAETVAELRPKAAGVSKADARTALGLLELSEADGHADFGLSEQEIAAARLLRDEQAHTTALAEVGREIREQGQRLAEMSPAAPKKNEPGTGPIFVSNF